MFFEKTGPTLRVNMDVDASSVWLWFGLISLISDKKVNNLDSSNKYFDTDSVPISWLRRIIHVLVWFGLIFFFFMASKTNFINEKLKNTKSTFRTSSIEKYNIKGEFDNTF